MDRRITPDNGDIDSPSQTGQPRLPRRSTPNVDVRSPSQGGRPHLPHQSTPDVDTHSPSQVGHSNLPHRSTPDNINARSPSLTEHRDLPHQSTPDVDIYSQSHAGHSGSGLPRQITPEDVDTRWPFRAGYPRLLRPSVVSIPIEDEAEKPISDADIDRLQSRITEILDSYDLPWCTSLTPLPEVVYRRQKFGTFGLPRVLIHCNYDKDTSYSKKWTEAVVEIYSETQSVVKGDCEVGVELVDKAIMNSQICSLPTPMSQELSANWEIGHNYCEQILHLFEAPHDMFQVMVPIGRCVRRTGLFYDRDPTCEWTAVVFFDALNAEDVLWDSLEERIRSILPSHIDIEIRQRSGPVFYSPPSFLDKYVEGRIPSPEEYVRPPQPGCDIGVQGSRSAGTMGGYVATEDKNGKRTTYGITNAHVVLQSYEKCVFSASADSGIRIVSPSEMSRTEAKSELLKQIPRLENQIPIHKEVIDAWEEEDPDLVQRRKKVLESVESELASAKRTLELIEQEPYVGSVHNASIGDTVYSTASSQCEIMMDLALIKMHCPGAERPQQIYLKEKIKPPRILPHATCDTWETDSLGVSHDGDGKNHIKVVGKLSRTGVYTFGIVNDFRAVAFPFTENGVENKKKHYMWVVSNPASYSKQKPFSRAGDAGSFVIAAADWEYCDYDNRVAMPSPQAPLKTRYKSTQPFVVGLLFGRTGDEELSYFIPFDAVKSEIESLTGEEMVWPQKRSDCVRDDVA